MYSTYTWCSMRCTCVNLLPFVRCTNSCLLPNTTPRQLAAWQSSASNEKRCICAREFALRQPSPPAARTSLDDSPARVQSVVECVCDHRKCCFDVNELSQFHVCVAHKHMSTYTHACDPTVVVSIYSAICCTHMYCVYWCVVRVHLTSHCDHLQPHSEPRDGIARLL